MAGVQLERKSSIETEPRTLNIEQIEFAREAARYVVKNRTIEEALSIFTEGLEPVKSVVKMNEYTIMEEGMEKEELEERRRLLSLMELRDVVSAPF